jgi:DNA repair protein RadC
MIGVLRARGSAVDGGTRVAEGPFRLLSGGTRVQGVAWEKAVGNVAAATQPESVRGNSFLSELPRERLLRLGAGALTDSELLCVLLAGGGRANPVLSLAEALVATGGGLKALFLKEPQELVAHPGLGRARASQMLAALELGRRVQRSTELRPRLRFPREIYAHLAPSLSAQAKESFHVLCFNSRHFLLRQAKVSEGSADACSVDPREVFSVAVLSRATAMVVAHNHPSGDPEPSSSDLMLTQQLVDAGRVLNVRVLDHLIVGDACYVSLAERGRMPLPTAC